MSIFWQLHSPEAEKACWASGIITALTVLASIVIAASISVASRMATDHSVVLGVTKDFLRAELEKFATKDETKAQHLALRTPPAR